MSNEIAITKFHVASKPMIKTMIHITQPNNTGQAPLIRSHSLARIYFELSGNSN